MTMTVKQKHIQAFTLVETVTALIVSGAIFVGIFALIAHLLADISYSYLDPRIRIKSQG